MGTCNLDKKNDSEESKEERGEKHIVTDKECD